MSPFKLTSCVLEIIEEWIKSILAMIPHKEHCRMRIDDNLKEDLTQCMNCRTIEAV